MVSASGGQEISDHGPWVGRSLPRREDAALLQGQALFIDDLAVPPATLAAAMLRSPHAHAAIRSIDATAALAIRGVRAVLTGRDIAAITHPVPNALRAPVPYFPIAVDRVRFVGEPVAVIVADDRYVAEDAFDHIVVDYEILPNVVDPGDAALASSPPLHEKLGSNIVHRKDFRFGDPDEAFAKANHVVSVDVRYPRIMSTPIETYGVIAEHESARDRFTIWSNFQGPFIGHSLIARALKTPATRVRMISAPASGGSFGIKWGVFSYAILLAAAAKLARAPLKWIEDRAEHLAASSCSTDRVTHMEGAFTNDGRLLGLRVRQLENVGAYLRPPEPSTLYRTQGNLNGPYDVRHIAIENTVVLTNQMPTGLNRGFGGPQYYFPLERLMHEAARQLGIDALELRLRNLVRPEAMPYACASGVVFDGGDYPATLRKAAVLTDYDWLKTEREKAKAAGDLFGIGLAVSVESSASSLAYVDAALPKEENARNKSGGISIATVSADPSGQIVLRLPTVPAGQGHETALSQLVADEIGIAPDDIEVVTTIDTSFSDWSIASGNYANRFSGADTTAAVLAARQVAGKFRRLAAAALDALPDEIELKDGYARVTDRNASISLKRLAAWTHWDSSQLPEGESGGISETAVFTPTMLLPPDADGRVASSLSSTLMCDIAAVRICRESGRLTVVRYGAVHDVGRLLNPALVEGQVRGGFAHGFGAATLERITYDGQGQLLTGTFADYLCPTAADMPPLLLAHVSYPTDRNATGARGLGDGSSMNVPAAIANAIADAIGRSDITLPFTPSRIWTYLQELDPDAAPDQPPGAKTTGAEASSARAQSGQLVGEGEIVLPQPPERVWAALFDVAGLRRIIPGCRDLQEVAPDKFTATIVLSVAGMRSSYNAKIELSDKIEPVSLRISGGAEGSLGHGQGEALVRLAAMPDGKTRLSYRYRTQVGGRVASVGHRMLDGVVRLLTKQFFASLSQHLEPGGAATGMRGGLRRLLGVFRRGPRP